MQDLAYLNEWQLLHPLLTSMIGVAMLASLLRRSRSLTGLTH